MKIKLTLFVTVLAAALFGMGCGTKENSEAMDEQERADRELAELEREMANELANLEAKSKSPKEELNVDTTPKTEPEPKVKKPLTKEESAKVIIDVILVGDGGNKVAAIKAVREIKSGLGLKAAKEFVEAAPKALLYGVSKDEAEEAKRKLEAAGARVELK